MLESLIIILTIIFAFKLGEARSNGQDTTKQIDHMQSLLYKAYNERDLLREEMNAQSNRADYWHNQYLKVSQENQKDFE